MRYYTTQILSANQELTPEGFLLCRAVPIARTGTQLYLGRELMDDSGKMVVQPAPDGVVLVERPPEVVFSDQTITSFEGKPFTLGHPSEDVTPQNWSKLAKGTVQNVRRGASLEDDLLLADVLITDAGAIAQVKENGIKEVSCGYQAEYEQTEVGRGRQTKIIGNHVALVAQGRCGTRCAIQDEGTHMKAPQWLTRARAALKARDAAEIEKVLEESVKDAESEETEAEKKKREAKETEDRKTADSLNKLTDAVTAVDARLKKLEDGKSKDEETAEEKAEREKKEKEKKEAESGDRKSRDAAALRDGASDVFARAEILAPGIERPTLTADAAADPKKFSDSLCALKRRALEAAHSNPKTRDAVKPLVANVDLSKLSCDALHSTFVGASELVRIQNNGASAQATFDGSASAKKTGDQISEMNKAAREFWANHGSK